MTGFFDDFRIGLRQHTRRPSFALTIAGTLALAIGAAMGVFSVVNAVLLRALPFTAPERLVWVASVRSDNPSAPFTLPELMDYRGRTRTLAALAAYANWSASVAGDEGTERFQGMRVTANAFDVLGVSPAAGRLFTESDDRPDATRVVVFSYRLWQRKYGGSPGVVGTAARINGQPYVVVGVLPAHFPLPLPGVDVLTPLVPEGDPLRHVRNSVNFLRLFGRLQPAADAAQAQAELTAICRSLREQFPVEYARKEAVRVDALHAVLVADVRSSMLVLFAAALLVLAAALANVTSLALVRAVGRRAELSMRTAIGATRAHLVRQLATEAMLLVAAGTLGGWLIGTEATRVATRWAPASIPRLGEVSLDRAVLLFAALLAALATALLTAAPLFAAGLWRAREPLRPVPTAATGDRRTRRARHVMVVGQIAAALVLILAAIALMRNLRQLQGLRPGFDADGVFQVRLTIPPAYRTPDDVARFVDRLSERLTASPGVRELGVVSVAPLSGLLATVPFAIAGQPADERQRASANIRAISPRYLATVTTRVLQGRGFDETDRADTRHVALVSAALAARFAAGRALGERLLIDDNNAGPRPVEVVGVVEDVRQTALDLPPTLDIYLPLRQIHADGVSFLRANQFWMVRTDSDPATFGRTFLTHLRAVDPDAAVSGAGTMRAFVDASLGPRRFTLGLFGAFAGTSLVLAVVGLYGLVSYGVSQRAREIAVRQAIGATRADVERLILHEAAWLGALGTVLGLAAAGALRVLAAGGLPGEGRRAGGDLTIDPIAGATATVLLLAIGFLAAWLPARRAARIAPTEALKAQ
jgi:putative ABC transport system permease protein